jgi:uncharacterized protein YjdB
MDVNRVFILPGREQEMSNNLSLQRAVSILLAIALILTAVFALPIARPSEETRSYAAPTIPTPIDFVAQFYEDSGITTGHVFDSVTLERLIRVLRVSDKKSVVLLGSPRNPTTKATIQSINEVAKDYGIEKIYLFDPHIAYDPNDPAVAPLNVFDTTKLYGDAYKKLLTTRTATNGSLLKYIDSAYSAEDTYLFVYDRKGNVDDMATIAADLRIAPAALPISSLTTLKTDIKAVFTDAGLTDGAPDETRLGQFDFFRSWTGGTALITDAHKDGFRLNSITYPELLALLKESGTHNIINVGSWCPDSKAAIGLISENATRYESSTVYAFDFRLEGGLVPSETIDGYARSAGNLSITSANGVPTTTTGVNGYKNDQWGTRYLGAHLIAKLAPYDSGLNQTVWYHPNGIPANSSDLKQGTLESVQKKFRSPFLIQWNKASNPKVVKNWLHRLASFELPWHSDAASSKPGDYIDAELSSGTLTNPQKEQLKADLGTFFSGTQAINSAPRQASAIVIPTSKGGADSGCGDDNDPIRNLNQTTLIPYNGTDEYDVSSYDISIDFDPAGSTKGQFTGKTVIKATAAKALTNIQLDFKVRTVTAVQLRNNSTGETLTATFRQEHDDDKNLHKLIVSPTGAGIPAGAAFQIMVEYSTGYLDDFVADSEPSEGFSKTRNGTGGVAIGEPFGATYWFPVNNTPADGATFKLSLIYPSTGGYVGVSNGKNTSTATASGKTTKVWEVTADTAPYQIFAAFSNDYKELAQTVTLKNGREINALSYVNNTIYTANQNRNRDKIGTLYNRLPYYIQQIEAIAGPYPGESIGFVFDDLSDGHGDSAQWGAVETKDRPFYTTNGVTSENTFVHEFVHQWFGDAVRIRDWKSLWLNEAFATYVTDLYYENTNPAFNSIAKWKAVYDREGPNSLFWESAPANILLETDLFGDARPAYYRGALALAALRVSIGDESFFRILREWPAAKKGQSATSQDFIAFAENVSGLDLADFSKIWLYGTAKPAAFPTERLTVGKKDDGDNSKPDPILVSDISLTAAAKTVAPGKTLTLTAAVTPDGATNKALTWTSGDSKIATVDGNGLVKGVAEGSVTITATANDGSGKTGTLKLTVAKPVTAVVTPLTTLYLKKGASFVLPVAAYNGKSTAARLTWTSSNPKVLTVSANGKIVAKKSGKVTITVAALNGVKTSITITVVAKSLAVKKIALSGVGKTLKKGKTARIKVKLTPAKTTDRKITFRSSKSSVLSVDKAGKLTAHKKGKATITVKVGSKNVKKTITVK